MVRWWGISPCRGRGVSTVIGVVLLVAIVTAMAGVVGYAVLGFGEETRTPTPRFSETHVHDDRTTGNGHYLNVTHESGQMIETANVTLRVNDAVVRDASGARVDDAAVTQPYALRQQVGDTFASAETFSVNATLFEHASGGPIGSGEYLDLDAATVRLVWTPPHEGRSEIVLKWTGPDA